MVVRIDFNSFMMIMARYRILRIELTENEGTYDVMFLNGGSFS